MGLLAFKYAAKKKLLPIYFAYTHIFKPKY